MFNFILVYVILKVCAWLVGWQDRGSWVQLWSVVESDFIPLKATPSLVSKIDHIRTLCFTRITVARTIEHISASLPGFRSHYIWKRYGRCISEAGGPMSSPAWIHCGKSASNSIEWSIDTGGSGCTRILIEWCVVYCL